MSVHQNPTYTDAYVRLALLYSRYLDQSKRGAHYARQAEIARRRLEEFRSNLDAAATDPEKATEDQTGKLAEIPVIESRLTLPDLPLDESMVIVSGLPRSGTSMMMQMLQQGGLPVLADDHRPSDPSNPRGYLEFEKAKALKNDRTWLAESKGKAVKLVAQLLPFLPPGLEGADSPSEDCPYRIIFMQRPFEEVIASQNRMLEHQKPDMKKGGLSDDRLASVFARQLERIAELLKSRGIPTLVVSYHEALKDPVTTARNVNHFLGRPMDEEEMAKAVEPSLHRERSDDS